MQLGYSDLAGQFTKIHQKVIYINPKENLYKTTWIDTESSNYGLPYLTGYGNRVGVGQFATLSQLSSDEIDFHSQKVKKTIVEIANSKKINIENINISKHFSNSYLKSNLTNTFLFKMINDNIGFIFSCNGHGFKMSLGMSQIIANRIFAELNC